MSYKILESHILFNHPHGDYLISVAIESSVGWWKAYYKQVNEISIESFIEVARTGEKFKEHRALEVFPDCRNFQQQGRLKYES
jgi:hypothetical protein